MADQALVADVEDVVRLERPRAGGREEAAVGIAEDVDHGAHRLGRDSGDAGDLLQPRRPPDVAAGGRPLAEAAEQDLGDPLPFGSRDSIDLVGLAREGPLQAAERLVVGQRQLDRAIGRRGRTLPEPHQGVLHQGELVGAGAHVVEHAVDQRGLDPAVEDPGRPLDRLLALVAGQLRA